MTLSFLFKRVRVLHGNKQGYTIFYLRVRVLEVNKRISGLTNYAIFHLKSMRVLGINKGINMLTNDTIFSSKKCVY